LFIFAEKFGTEFVHVTADIKKRSGSNGQISTQSSNAQMSYKNYDVSCN